MAKKNFLQDLLKSTGNEYATVAEQGIIAGDISGYIDTGSLSLNCLLGGSPFRGLAKNKILGLAGEESTGKTFYSLAIAKNFQDAEPEGNVIDFTTESDFGKDTLLSRKIDVSRFGVVPVETVEEFRSACMVMIEQIKEISDAPKCLFIVDSLGNLSTVKEIKDIVEGTNKRDMTKQQLLRGAFRALTLKLGKLQIPMIVLNHTYEVVGAYVPTKEMSGGGGLKFAASQICFLSKKKGKEKIDKVDQHIGSIITVKLDKSRLTREGLKVDTLLRFDSGLDRYYGLLDIAEEAGIFKKLSTQYELPDGSKHYESVIEKDGARYFTPDILQRIEEYTLKHWVLGGNELQALLAQDAVEEAEFESKVKGKK
jgi:RecA/RadA recombinase